jgi:phosphoesterase RecJ-like protein
MKTDITTISQVLESAKKIVITTHVNPDGDAIGSSLGLYNILKQFPGKEINVIVPNAAPEFLMWMPGSDKIVFFDRNQKFAKSLIANADLIFSLDYNALHRIDIMEKFLRETKAFKALIDHHPEPETSDFDWGLSKTQTSSTAQLISEFCTALDLDTYINQDIAECIFTGIVTDTGSFSYACNYPGTFRVVANLIERGLNIELVNRKLFNANRIERLKLLGYCLNEKLVFIPELNTSYISITKEELARFDFQPGDTEGLVNYALSLKGTRLAVLITERENLIRLSFRSKGTIDVNEVARTHFSGGGHLKAAGGNSELDMQQTIKKLVNVLENYNNELHADI